MAKPLLDMSAARVFLNGIFTSPRVAQPEGVAVHRDGSIWCDTETGDLMQWLWDEFSVSVSKPTLSHIVRAMGYRKLSARPRHHAQKSGAIDGFKKRSWAAAHLWR